LEEYPTEEKLIEDLTLLFQNLQFLQGQVKVFNEDLEKKELSEVRPLWKQYKENFSKRIGQCLQLVGSYKARREHNFLNMKKLEKELKLKAMHSGKSTRYSQEYDILSEQKDESSKNFQMKQAYDKMLKESEKVKAFYETRHREDTNKLKLMEIKLQHKEDEQKEMELSLTAMTRASV